MEKSKKGTYVSLFEHVNENSIEQTQIDTNANNQEQSIKFNSDEIKIILSSIEIINRNANRKEESKSIKILKKYTRQKNIILSHRKKEFFKFIKENYEPNFYQINREFLNTDEIYDERVVNAEDRPLIGEMDDFVIKNNNICNN